MGTASLYLKNLLSEIDAGPITVARVCYAAGMDPSVVSRWKRGAVEPRLSSLERLAEPTNANGPSALARAKSRYQS